MLISNLGLLLTLEVVSIAVEFLQGLALLHPVHLLHLLNILQLDVLHLDGILDLLILL